MRFGRAAKRNYHVSRLSIIPLKTEAICLLPFSRFARKANRTRLRPFDSGWSSCRPYRLENRSKTRPFLVNLLRVFLTEIPATLRRVFQQNNEFIDVVCIPPFVQEANINLQSIIFKILTDENRITSS